MNTVFAKEVYTNGKVLENMLIMAADGVVTAMRRGSPGESPLTVERLAPGFLDLQVNGGARLNFTENGTLDAVADIDQACAATGTGYTLPTLISAPLENILRGIEAVRAYRERLPGSGVLGMHLEGPFLNPIRCGAHPHNFIRNPTDAELDEIIRHGEGVVRLMTIAPELFTDAQLDKLLDAGITLSVGHSNASYEAAIHAFGRGIHLVTHLYNAMSPFLARHPGLIGAIFDSPEVATPLILDGFHSHYSAARMAYKIKKDKLFLVSDALFAGNTQQHYVWGEFNAHLQDDKYLTDDGALAGSTISLGDAVRNAVYQIGIPLPEAIQMVTERPAAEIGMEHQIGHIRHGYPAVFTVFDGVLDGFTLLRL